MKIAYQRLNLADSAVRARLIDDLVQHVEDDETARQYLEDIAEFINELVEENDWYIAREEKQLEKEDA